MSEIWNNPLMWNKANLPGNTPSDDKDTSDKRDQISIDLSALDALINDAEAANNEANILPFDFPSSPDSWSSLQNIQIGTPKDSDDRLSSHLLGIPTGHTAFGRGAFSSGAASVFDFYNALAIVGEEGGIAERMGVSDGNAIEAGMNTGMDVKTAIESRDPLKLSLLMKKMLPDNTDFSLKNLDYLREYALKGNLDELMQAAGNYGIQPPEDISATDIYYIMMASKADQKNFDLIFTNINKTVV
ncbi:MAG: hypothetical protein AAF621_08205 [Pseudomonadota bacterium]